MTAPANRRLITEDRLFDGLLIKEDLLPDELGLTTQEVADILADTAFSSDGITMVPNAESDAVIFSMAPAGAGPAANSTITNVTSSITVVTILALNNSRKGASVFNDSASLLYLALGAAASTTNFTTRVPPDGYFEVPFEYLGVITGLWASASGFARVTEFE
jgi:hypothetical protein